MAMATQWDDDYYDGGDYYYILYVIGTDMSCPLAEQDGKTVMMV
jgi:hypothetical protein